MILITSDITIFKYCKMLIAPQGVSEMKEMKIVTVEYY